MQENKKRRLKKPFRILFTLFLLFFVTLLAIFITFNFLLSPTSRNKNEVLFEVESGSSVYSVGKDLKNKGIIRSYLAYKLYTKLNNVSGYKAGLYKIDKSYSTKKIVEILEKSKYLKSGINITFKEGQTIRDIAKEISKNTSITNDEFYSKLEDKAYIDSLVQKYWFLTDEIKDENIYYALEGYLFPDTYNFKKDVTLDEIIEVMLNQTDKVFSKYKDKIDSSKYSIHQIVTLSSIVEKEGIYKEDRKNIAAIFFNRLNKGMSLGSDITTYYAFKVDLSSRDLTKAEINTYNPYNTRGPLMNGKLPVGPVSNFSESSFDAVLNPADNDYYYFVADNEGNTYFSKTYNEHNKIIKKLKANGKWLQW